ACSSRSILTAARTAIPAQDWLRGRARQDMTLADLTHLRLALEINSPRATDVGQCGVHLFAAPSAPGMRVANPSPPEARKPSHQLQIHRCCRPLGAARSRQTHREAGTQSQEARFVRDRPVGGFSSFGGTFGYGRSEGQCVKAGVLAISYDALSGSSQDLNSGGGYEISLQRSWMAQGSPFANLSIESGPKNVLSTGVDMSSRT